MNIINIIFQTVFDFLVYKFIYIIDKLVSIFDYLNISYLLFIVVLITLLPISIYIILIIKNIES